MKEQEPTGHNPQRLTGESRTNYSKDMQEVNPTPSTAGGMGGDMGGGEQRGGPPTPAGGGRGGRGGRPPRPPRPPRGGAPEAGEPEEPDLEGAIRELIESLRPQERRGRPEFEDQLESAASAKEAWSQRFQMPQIVELRERILRERDPDQRAALQVALAELKKQAREQIDNINPQDRYMNIPIVLSVIVQDDELADMFFDKIIRLPDATPGGHYQLGLYAASAKDDFLAAVQGSGDPEKADVYGTKLELRENFHNLRLALRQGNTRDFTTLGLTVNQEQYQQAVGYAGVGTVNRLYEQAYWASGYTQNAALEPEQFRRIEEWVKEEFHRMVEEGVVKNRVVQDGRTTYERNLEKWEEERAISIGRNFFSVKLRSADVTAMGEVITTTGARQWESFEQESITRLSNPIRFLAYKFRMGTTRGGDWLLTQYYKEHKALLLEKLKEKKLHSGSRIEYRESRLTHLGKIRRATVESAAPMGRSGYETGWRGIEAYMNSVPLKLPRVEYDALIAEYRRVNANNPDNLVGNPLRIMSTEGNDVLVPAGHYLQVQTSISGSLHENEATRTDRLTRFTQQVDFYTGLIVGMESDIPLEVKTRMWEKTARLIPTRIAYYLSDANGNSLVDAMAENEFGQNNWQREWGQLQRKLRFIEEKRVLFAEQAFKEGREYRTPGTILDWYNSLPQAERTVEITGRERAFTERIIRLGIRNAEELALIEWPSTPYMDDAPFGAADYGALGSEFSRRRIADASAISEANGAVLGVFVNPGQAMEEVRKAFFEAQKGLDTPHGLKTGSDLLFPFIKTYFEYISYKTPDKYPGVSLFRWLIKTPQSVAQEYYGSEGPAYGPDEIHKQTELYAKDGILRRKIEAGERISQLEKMRKRIGARWWQMMLYLVGVWGPLALAVAPYEFSKSLKDAK